MIFYVLIQHLREQRRTRRELEDRLLDEHIAELRSLMSADERRSQAR